MALGLAVIVIFLLGEIVIMLRRIAIELRELRGIKGRMPERRSDGVRSRGEILMRIETQKKVRERFERVGEAADWAAVNGEIVALEWVLGAGVSMKDLYNDPAMYDAAKQATLDSGFPWTDPRTGETFQPPFGPQSTGS